MADNSTKPARTGQRPKPRKTKQSTRQRLLEAAGQIFAEKGFDRTTGKEICEQAGTNTAAVNYYFGGVDGLYSAVMQEARSRLVPTAALLAAVAGKVDVRAKLEAVIELGLRAMTSPTSSSWVLRVLGREIIAPSPAMEALWKEEIPIRMGVFRSIVSELMGLPEDHPAVTQGCFIVAGPFVMLLVYDRQMLHRLFPDFSFAPKEIPAITRHLVQFILGGLAALASTVQKEG
jgi:AcrR family transcriptional regulator